MEPEQHARVYPRKSCQQLCQHTGTCLNFRPLRMHLAAKSHIKATLTNYNIKNTIEMTAVGSPAHIAIYHTRRITISKSVWPPNASHQTRVKRARPNLEVSYNSYDSFSLWAKMDPSPSVPRPGMCGEIREDPWRMWGK